MERSNQHDRYPGTYILVPELCLYEEGEPPISGRYEIAQRSGEVHISISWQARDGSNQRIEFGGRNDGAKIPIENPGVTHFSITRISDSMLDSAAFFEDKEVAYARRCVSLDGQLLATVQVGYRTDGSSYRNFQVYRRDVKGET